MKNVLKTMLLIVALVLFSTSAQGQDEQKTFVVCTYMKVKPGMGQDYIKMEKAWKKIHYNRIDKGEILGWGLYTVPNAGTSNDYNMIGVTILDGDAQMARFYGDYVFADYMKGLSQEEIKIVQNTATFRDVVREDVYRLKDALAKNPGFPNVQWLTSHKLHKGVSPDDFVKVEKKLVNPVVQKLIDSNDIQFFGVYQRVLPSGTSSTFDIVRAYGYPDLETMLAFPPKWGAEWAKAHANFMGTGWKIDDHDDVAVELWKKVDCTCD